MVLIVICLLNNRLELFLWGNSGLLWLLLLLNRLLLLNSTLVQTELVLFYLFFGGWFRDAHYGSLTRRTILKVLEEISL